MHRPYRRWILPDLFASRLIFWRVIANCRNLKSGDLLAFTHAGAYGFSMASNYNSHPLPAEVLVEGERYRVIRRRQTLEDLIKSEIPIDAHSA